jgi:hypothetical protein
MLSQSKFMPSEKTKKLLDNLKNITAKTDRFARKPTPSSSNRWWPDTSSGSLPQSYDKAKRHKDEDGEEFFYIDRVYGGLFDYQSLEQKDGTTYKGKLYKKRRLMQGSDGKNFYSQCTVTADGRWFDNGGIPIIPPKELEIEKEEDKEKDPIHEMWSSEPSEPKEKKELNMLKGLK